MESRFEDIRSVRTINVATRLGRRRLDGWLEFGKGSIDGRLALATMLPLPRHGQLRPRQSSLSSEAGKGWS
jgi:hypothetical protein